MGSEIWHNLADVANTLGCGETQLLKLIQENKKLPLHVTPHNWYAHLWTYKRDENDDLSKVIEFNHETFKLNSDILKPAHPVKPLPLSIQNIQALSIKGAINEDVFAANDAIKSDGSIVSYFKLCDPQDYKKNFVAQLSIEDVVIRDNCFEKLKTIVSETPITKPISDNQKDKLHRIIGLITLLLSKKATKYSNGDKPNFTNISEDLLKELKELDKENKLETLGLSDTNLRSTMSDGVKLLYGKKI